ncbi:MAG: isoprenoid biosynthesis glyoxalase ElbB [Deltaproteobacteria bacterium]|nr:isoprenoid biosynthesis glyoxalase ElbB [Deltaproteobacteria bacterium]
MAKTTIGVILSGAGYLDGAEIHESVLVLLSLAHHGSSAKIFAPDIVLKEVDHKAKTATGAERSVLKEAARIARSEIHDLASANGTDVEGWILPGGFGAAKNLSDFATKGAQATVNKEVNRVIRAAFAARIPVGACCIAPVVLGLIGKASSTKLKLTIGNDAETAKVLVGMGHVHVDKAVDEILVDADRKVVTTPAYMLDAAIDEVARGIDKMVKQVVDWSREELSAPRNAPR